ncbi:TlyA family RNA methyltransferase [Arthrobacter sp. zg-Y820]|uniref:TlyA family RNA methyltransferase n=1 Tax=unclassified Arthrobacter TaxID=235627 RepID=UPI00254241D6|nr:MULTISPECIES: TlyA family RNA methyltransferase [unclassified Arthrobacter]MCC9197936.1 TlyA family RNA methyltransferase [Arthrobacter sp. zg-Y820]MDK1280803.1 TlyA family RNA methyltransferase [Arthrobacter sp. zg.Y820]MDK1360855.1 TlyA family RNA methyltransferase [Arthrobacter sp. zg-Y1219]WIB11092.1 TlyA family RNA methyltransferase [Arthrobacter sp. zg-Y820]
MVARLDQELVARGLARSRTHAAKLIAAGRVARAGAVLGKASASVSAEDPLSVLDDGVPDYVSRAGHKLAGALDAFPQVQPEGLRCLDAGASTGGFTDVLLRRGAERVVAVDVGHDQLVDALRVDPRVDVHEGLNVRYLVPEAIGGPVDLTVADLSFISLTLVLAPLAAATRPGGSLLLMVKPQFEVGREKLEKAGVVMDPQKHRLAVTRVVSAAMAENLRVAGLARSPLPGQNGNVEFFLWLQVAAADQQPAALPADAQAEARRLVEEAFDGFDGAGPDSVTDRFAGETRTGETDRRKLTTED